MCLLFLFYISNLNGWQKERCLVLKERADVITRAHCCVDCCVLNKLGWQKGRDVVYDIMKSRDSMTREESKNDLRIIVRVGSLW